MGDDARAATLNRISTQINLASISALCRRHAPLIIIWAIVGTGLIGAAIFYMTPTYQASAEVVMDSRVQRQSDYQSVMSGPFTLTDYAPIVRSETQVLESPSLAARVIDELGLANAKDFQPRIGPRARALALMIDLAERYLPPGFADAIKPAQLDPEAARNLLIEEYLHRLSVVNDGRSLTISIMFWASDPKLAAQVANAHAHLYIADQSALKEATARNAMNWIGQQRERLGADLHAKEAALRDFREQAGLVHAQGSTVIAQQVLQINDQLSRARADLAQRQAMIAQVQRASATGSDVPADVLNSNLISHLRQQEAELSTALVKLQKTYSSTSRVVRGASAQVEDVRNKIAQEAARIVSSMRVEAEVARDRVDSLSDRLKGLQLQLVGEDRSDMRVTEMERDIDAQRGVYRDLMNRQQQIEAQAGAEPADAHVISLATTPRLPFYPNKPLFLLLGFVAASISGVGLAFVADHFRKGIDQLDEIEGAAAIMHFHAVPLVSDTACLPDHLLDKPMSEFADCIRSLRSDIMHARRSPPPRVLVVTSTLPGEGKTMIALSVARSMATAGLHVLLIDCDLRRSKCVETIGAKPSKKGLIGVLQGRTALAAAVVDDPRSSVNLLAAEQHVAMPQDLLDSPGFRHLLEDAQAQYDFVIMDTPPIAAVTDAWLVARYADAIVLAVRWQSTSARAIAEAIQAFEKRRLPLTGLFLNAVDMARSARNAGRGDIYKAIQAYYPAA
jgi:polysaccharide biosynthesis transport protein